MTYPSDILSENQNQNNLSKDVKKEQLVPADNPIDVYEITEISEIFDGLLDYQRSPLIWVNNYDESLIGKLLYQIKCLYNYLLPCMFQCYFTPYVDYFSTAFQPKFQINDEVFFVIKSVSGGPEYTNLKNNTIYYIVEAYVDPITNRYTYKVSDKPGGTPINLGDTSLIQTAVIAKLAYTVHKLTYLRVTKNIQIQDYKGMIRNLLLDLPNVTEEAQHVRQMEDDPIVLSEESTYPTGQFNMLIDNGPVYPISDVYLDDNGVLKIQGLILAPLSNGVLYVDQFGVVGTSSSGIVDLGSIAVSSLIIDSLNGVLWANNGAVSGEARLEQLQNVNINNPVNGESLIYLNGVWTNIPVSGGGSSSGARWGLITGTLSDQLDLQAALDGKSPVGHLHDDRYYTKTQLQTGGQSSVHWNNITNRPNYINSLVVTVGTGGMFTNIDNAIDYLKTSPLGGGTIKIISDQNYTPSTNKDISNIRIEGSSTGVARHRITFGGSNYLYGTYFEIANLLIVPSTGGAPFRIQSSSSFMVFDRVQHSGVPRNWIDGTSSLNTGYVWMYACIGARATNANNITFYTYLQNGLTTGGGTVYRDSSSTQSGATNEYLVDSHSSLAGLNNDDHTQYILVNGTRALGGNWSAGGFRITNHATPVNPQDVVNKQYVDNLSGNFVPYSGANNNLNLGSYSISAYSYKAISQNNDDALYETFTTSTHLNMKHYLLQRGTKTTNDTPTLLHTINLEQEGMYLISVDVLAMGVNAAASGQSGSFLFKGTYKRANGTIKDISVFDSVIINLEDPSWTAIAYLEINTSNVKVYVQGVNGQDILWQSTTTVQNLIKL